MNELTNTPYLAGLPTTKANPAFSKNTFKLLVPKFANYIDGELGEEESIINEVTADTVITNVQTKLSFNNTYVKDNGDKTVLDLDANKDIILGKNTSVCYREGYNSLSEIILTDTSGSSNEITISFLVDDVIIKTNIVSLDPLEAKPVEIEFDIGTSKIMGVLTILISDVNNGSTITSFSETITSNFKAARGDGAALYEVFCGISNSKIIQTIWNIDWELGMAYCIAHYLAITNTESEVSYGLGDIAVNSGPRGIKVAGKTKGELQTKYDFKNIMLTHNETKFWNTTEYGRLLITLLYTKAVPTIIVVN